MIYPQSYPQVRYGLLGRSIAYTKSPSIYSPWFKDHNLNAVFDVIDVPECNDAVLLGILEKYAGFCITIPYKQTVYDWLNDPTKKPGLSVYLSDAALGCGVVNVVKIDETSVSATNTDAMAFVDLLKKQLSKMPIQNQKAIILGAGGAAKATLWGLQQCGVFDVMVVARDVEAARKSLGADHIVGFDEFKGAGSGAIVVNSTPMGSDRMPGQMDFLSLFEKNSPALMIDWVYSDGPTEMGRWAENHKIPFVGGLSLLRTQAYFSFEFWLGFKPE